MYDLPVSPAFGVFTAPILDPSTPDEDNAVFRLKRKAYNGVTSKPVTMPVLCKYEPRGKHLNVAEATKKYQIFSVAGELVTLKSITCIVCDIIEWTYQIPGNPKTGSDKLSKNKKAKYEELEKLAEKFNFIANKKQSNPRKEDANYDSQEESSSRAKRL